MDAINNKETGISISYSKHIFVTLPYKTAWKLSNAHNEKQ